MSSRIRVLIIDDSALIRRALTNALDKAPDIEVIGTAADAIVAREKIPQLKPEVLTLDIEMPRLNGLSFLKSLMQTAPLPVIVVSSLVPDAQGLAIEALQNGAVEVVPKPSDSAGWEAFGKALAQKIRGAAQIRHRVRPAGVKRTPAASTPPPAPSSSGGIHETALLAIGASTGGPEALTELLLGLPAQIPPLVITQHIPAGFSRALAERLDRLCAMRVKEAEDGDHIVPGRALVAPGGRHLVVRRCGGVLRAMLHDEPPVCYQRPSVDVMFQSVAETIGPDAVGVLLTGMGSDGAAGMLKMREAGARTIAQDETTCVVFGMPREAIRLGAVEKILPLPAIAPQLLRWMRQPASVSP